MNSTVPAKPALYPVRISHTRYEGVRHRFRYGSYLWLVDLDHLPTLPGPIGSLARFRSRDHVGDPHRSIRANIDAVLAEHGIDLAGGRVHMLASAAVLGHVFNPLSLFWCYDRHGRLAGVVAEVHNTYGERHCYMLQPDSDSSAEADKRFYVSPFFPVDGRYVLDVPEPDERLDIAARLYRQDEDTRESLAFAASLTGSRRSGNVGQLLRLLAAYPLPTLRVSALIRWQGIRLWLRRLPVAPRTPAPQEVDR